MMIWKLIMESESLSSVDLEFNLPIDNRQEKIETDEAIGWALCDLFQEEIDSLMKK